MIHFSYGEANQGEPNLFGTVVENDNEVSIAIKTSSGDELILNYALIRSLLIKSAAATPTASAPIPTPVSPPTPVPAPVSSPAASKKTDRRFSKQTPTDISNLTDNQLKDLFSQLPKNEQKKIEQSLRKL